MLIFFFSFFFLYWDYRLTRLTIDISGRENGGDDDSGIIISFKTDRPIPSLINTVKYFIDPPHITFFGFVVPAIHVDEWLDTEEHINKRYPITCTLRELLLLQSDDL